MPEHGIPQAEIALPASDDARRLVEHALEVARCISSWPILAPRTPEEILDFDESGVPR